MLHRVNLFKKLKALTGTKANATNMINKCNNAYQQRNCENEGNLLMSHITFSKNKRIMKQ